MIWIDNLDNCLACDKTEECFWHQAYVDYIRRNLYVLFSNWIASDWEFSLWTMKKALDKRDEFLNNNCKYHEVKRKSD